MDIKNLESYIDKLNPEQRSAVNLGDEAALILAAAGSGKTSTLTYRIAKLIANGTHPGSIMAVTFTNKASKEMATRLTNIGVDVQTLWLGTFHSLCRKIISYHTKEVGLRKGFAILDSSDQLSFLKRTMRANGYDPKTNNAEEFQNSINKWKERGMRSKDLRSGSVERKIYELYEQTCLKENVVDFGELLLACYELFQNHPQIGESYQEKFKYVLVDEFQDTSDLQYKWLKYIGEVHRTVFAVGDDDQCLLSGTPVNIPDGKMNIERVIIGDIVLSLIGKTVVHCKVTDKRVAKYDGNVVDIVLENGKKLTSTENHIWFSLPNELDKNNLILTLGGTSSSLSNLEHTLELHIQDENIAQQIMDLGIVIKRTECGFWLYQKSSRYQEVLYVYKILVANFPELKARICANVSENKMRQMPASMIKVGYLMADIDGSYHKVTSVSTRHYKGDVYDLSVEHTHNYCVDGIVTHNSIYGWRSARPENLNQFLKDFNAKIIKIEKNYRSDANILGAANAVIKNNSNRQGKNLVPTRPAQKLINFFEALDDNQEANFIASEMKKMRRLKVPYREMAILYRTNGQSRSLERALNANGIPYAVYGGLRFFDRQEVKHAMAYLRLAHNPDDNLAFLRVANIPSRAIGDSSLKKLDVAAAENKCSLYEMVMKADAKTQKKFENFINVIETLRAGVKNKRLNDAVKVVIEKSGLEEMYLQDKKEGEERLDNLYELISAAEVFIMENNGGDVNVEDFLAFSTLDSDTQAAKRREESKDAVKLMTVHSSKGLEFNVVFVAGIEECLFPHQNSLGEASLIEEERRLMYVAITRARNDLYLTCAEERLIHGSKQRFVKSRFLKEIPKEYLLRVH